MLRILSDEAVVDTDLAVTDAAVRQRALHGLLHAAAVKGAPLFGIDGHDDIDPVKNGRGLAHDVHMTVGKRVERPGIDRFFLHACSLFCRCRAGKPGTVIVAERPANCNTKMQPPGFRAAA